MLAKRKIAQRSEEAVTRSRARTAVTVIPRRALVLGVCLALASPSVAVGAAEAATPAELTPPSEVYASAMWTAGSPGHVGYQKVSGSVHTEMTMPRTELAQSDALNCVSGTREEIRTERRGEGSEAVEIEVRVVRRQSGCGAGDTDSYMFDPVAGMATVVADVPAIARRWTYVRPTGGGSWQLEDFRESSARVLVDMEWTATSAPSPHSWVCIAYTNPPTPCLTRDGPVAGLQQHALVERSIEFQGLEATLKPTGGVMHWGAYLP